MMFMKHVDLLRKNSQTTLVGLSPTHDLPESFQTCQGNCNGSSDEIMLNSGCTTVGVKHSIITDDQLIDYLVNICW